MKRTNNRGEALLSPLGIIASIILLVLAVIAGVCIIWYNSFTEVDLSAVTSVSIMGYDSTGVAQLNVDVPEEVPEEFWKTVEITLDRDQKLSNGDQVTMSCTYDEDLAKEYKIRMIGTDESFEVSGLKELRSVGMDELFDGVSIACSGVSPLLTVEAVNGSSDPYIQNILFYTGDPERHYRAGDTVRVTADIDEEAALAHGIRFLSGAEGFVKDYEIPAGDSYLVSAEQLTAEDLQTLAERGKTFFTDQKAKEYGLRIFTSAHVNYFFVNSDTTFTWQNPRALSAYFNVATDETLANGKGYVNYLQICYEATLYQRCDGAAVQAEIVVQFDNLMEKADGTKDLGLESGRIVSASYLDADIKKMINSGEEDYTKTRLEF